MITDVNHLIWLDLEMTGLEVDQHRIIELAVMVTDANLNILDEGITLAVHQSDACLATMDDWCTTTHQASGLVSRVRASVLNEQQSEKRAIEYLRAYVPPQVAPMCGNSIGQDRRFLAKYMPKLNDYCHYRSVDVSSIKELARRWQPDLLDGFSKQGSHRALDDIQDSIMELRYYRDHFFKMN